MRAIAFAGAVLLALAAPVSAQLPRSVIDACWSETTPAEARVGYCTQVIGSGALQPKDMAGAYINRGNAYRNLKQHQRAIADYDQAIRLDPNNVFAYNNRGAAYAALKQHQRAIADYDQAIRLDPNFVAAYYNRGNAYAGLKQYQRAIADYDQAIRLNPNDGSAYYNRGYAYDDLKQYQRAIADYDQAIRLDPNNAFAYNNRGIAYGRLKQYQRAIADFEQAIRLDPNDAGQYNSRCWTRAVWGQQLEQALKDCNTSLRLKPNEASVHDSRGLVHLKAGRYAEAESDYGAASRLAPDAAHPLFGLGVVRLRRGNAAGQADLAAARRLDPKIEETYAEYGVRP